MVPSNDDERLLLNTCHLGLLCCTQARVLGGTESYAQSNGMRATRAQNVLHVSLYNKYVRCEAIPSAQEVCLTVCVREFLAHRLLFTYRSWDAATFLKLNPPLQYIFAWRARRATEMVQMHKEELNREEGIDDDETARRLFKKNKLC